MLRQSLINGFAAGSQFALVAVGLSLLYSVTRFLNFAVGAAFALSAYVTYALVVLVGFTPLPAFFLAVLVCGLLGALSEIKVYRRLRNHGWGSLAQFISSLGIYVGLQNLISLFFGDETQVLPAFPESKGFAVFGASLTAPQAAYILGGVSLTILSWSVLRTTRIGKVVRAVANDQDLAHSLGLPFEKAITFTSFASFAVVGAVGIVTAYDVGLTPVMGYNALLMGVVSMIVGGTGSIPGALVGGVVVGLVRHTSALVFSTQWQDLVVFLVVVLVLTTRPQGLLGGRSRWPGM